MSLLRVPFSARPAVLCRNDVAVRHPWVFLRRGSPRQRRNVVILGYHLIKCIYMRPFTTNYLNGISLHLDNA